MFYSAGDVCGDQCEAFCDAEEAVCGFAEDDDVKFGVDSNNCHELCSAWPVGVAGAASGDSLACREYHLGVAAGAGPVSTHCPHTYDDGGAAPTQFETMEEGGDGVCGNGCDQFCNLVIATCTGSNVQFGGDIDACTTACGSWEYGTRGEAGHNTFSCRYYHAWAATMDADLHCGHTAVDSPVCVGSEPVPSSGGETPTETGAAGTETAAMSTTAASTGETPATGLSGSGVAPLSAVCAVLAVIAALLL
jgi:hypothetical protein